MEPAIAFAEEQTEEEFESTALTVADEARSLRIRNDSEYEAAGHFLRTAVKAVLRRADEIFDPPISAAHAAHRASIAAKKKATADLLEAEKAVKKIMGAYAAEQDRKRLAAEAAARKAAEEAERKRREEAEALRSLGAEEEAAAVEAEPVAVAKVEVAKPKAEGVSIRRTWKFRITDPTKIRREFLMPNEAAIAKVVRGVGADAAGIVGGIEVYEDTSVVAR